MLITLDFESRSEADLRLTGAWCYAEHPSTDALCLYYHLPDGTMGHWQLLNDNTPPVRLFNALAQGILVEAHNAFFEYCLWNRCCVPRYGWPPIPLKQFRCSAAKSRSSGLAGSLELAGKMLNLPIQKQKEGKNLINYLCKPSRKSDQLWNEDQDKLDAFYNYCEFDVRTEISLSESCFDLTPVELEVWQLTELINYRGFRIDMDAVNKGLALIKEAETRYNNQLKEITNNQLYSANQSVALKEWINERLETPLPDLTKDTIASALTNDDLPDDVKKVLTIRQKLSKSSTKKIKKMVHQRANDGRVHNSLIYCGAVTTGRYSGTGVQVQNFPRGTIKAPVSQLITDLKTLSFDELELAYGSVLDVVSSSLRGFICAAPKHKFLALDWSAIEPRVLFWLTDQTNGLKAFRELDANIGPDVYRRFGAESIYFKPVNQMSDDERFFAKVALIGAGYGLGVNGYIAQCANYGVEVTESLAKKCITGYRRTYKKVVRFWKQLEKAWTAALNKVNTTLQVGKLFFRYNGKWLSIKLPSGRCLRYLEPKSRTTEGPYGLTKELSYTSHKHNKVVNEITWGGTVTENIIQAVARDILVYAMLEVEKAGYSIIMTVHDEIVVEVPNWFGSLDDFKKAMLTLPDWATGLPVSADGWEGKHYRK